MFRLASRQVRAGIIYRQKNSFGIFRTLLHLLRTSLNKIRWEQNQQFRALDQRNSTVPRNTEQTNQLFIHTEKQAALSQEQRMQRIDMILGTNTHFHEGKIFHERIDSDHLMQVEYLKKQNPQKSREILDWQNPQADVKVRHKNKKKYYQNISNLRVYPKHSHQQSNLADQTLKNTINFLANQTAYTAISLKPLEITMKSLEQQTLFFAPERPFQTEKYSYFRPQFTMQLFRVPKNLYNSNLLSDEAALLSLENAVEQVISLDEIYNTMKDFDTDERVHEYLRKVENGRIQYLFTSLSFNQNEDMVAIALDILDDGLQHCLLVKSLSSNKKMLPIFNVKPQAVFSSDSKHIYYIQRSTEGGYIQLVKRTTQSCWGQTHLVLPDSQEMIYRCDVDKQLKIGKDQQGNFIFLTIIDYGKKYSEKLYLISSSEQIKLIPVDQDGNCQYFYQLAPEGLVLAKKRLIQSGSIKYGNNQFYIENVQLIPFKQHLQIKVQNVGMTDLLPGKVKQFQITPEQLDFDRKKCIFAPSEHEFIVQIQVKNTHIIMILNYFSIYDKASFYCLPFKSSSHPHSLILKGGASLKLRSNMSSKNNQIIEYSHPQGPLLFNKIYNIWKRQLKDEQQQASKYHHQTFILNQQQYSFQLTFTCKQMYLDQKDLPVMLVILEQGQTFDQSAIRQFLEKGVAIVQFGGRGTFSKDLEHYIAGSRQNFNKFFDDLQTAVEFIGNSMTKNISLYCKGQISSLAGLWFNFYFPYLFNATVLHNGLYDLSDDIAIKSRLDFFGQPVDVNEGNNMNFDYERFNVFKHKFRMLFPSQFKITKQPQHNPSFQLGQLQNIIISSSIQHRLHSRLLVRRLRQNSTFRYDQVYLKQHEDQYMTDLYNLSYIYSKIRDRLERQVHEFPTEQDN